MHAAIFNGPHKIDFTDYPLTELKADEVLVKVKACGVCGTDFHIFEGKAPAKVPVILGHEYTGEIVEIGKNITSVKAGDRAAINPNIHCGYCYFCKKGKINLCSNLKALGVTLNGGFAQYSIVPFSQIHLLPNDFSLDNAAFAEPLSCCIHGIEQADIELNDSVAIIGSGTIGLLMMQLARLKGASKVFVLDLSNEKLELAEKSGADEVFNPADKSFIEKIFDLTSGGVDVSIECAGNASAAKIAMEIVKKGGKVTIFGLAGSEDFLNVNLQKFFHKEISVKSSLLNPNTFQTAVDLLVSSRIKVDLLNPEKLQLSEKNLNEIFSVSKNNNVIKYMLMPDD